jgi:N-acetyl-1-D-myo-inositol-2-amino-2-deoxy-alpha-D-glucopyranoside deacetylase
MPHQKKTIVAMFAHPDDEAFGPSGTLALLAKEHDVYLIVGTNGEAGENHHPDKATKHIIEIRRKEVITSSKILGIKYVHFLDFPDGNLSNTIYGQVLLKAEAIIKELKPDTLLTFEVHGLTGHMDHVFMTRIATSLYEGNDFIREIWYFCFEKGMRDSIQDYYRHKNFHVYFPKGYLEEKVDKVVDVSSVWGQKISSMHAHLSQQSDRDAYIKSLESAKMKEYFFVKNKDTNGNGGRELNTI